MTNSRRRCNRYANRKAQQVEFNVYDPVYYKNFQRTSKTSPQWIPYYRVVDFDGSKQLILKHQLDNKMIKCNVDQVRKAVLDEWTL